MKKIAIVLLVIFTSLLWAEDNTVPGDASGNDLEPVVRGLNFEMAAGVVTFIGNAGGDNAELMGVVYGISFGYDFAIGDKIGLGISGGGGIMQMDTKSINPDSPWIDDFSPILFGIHFDLTYLFTDRFQLGVNVGGDYHMNLEVKNKDGKLVKDMKSAGGGLTLEYFTYSRYFSLGLTADINYYLDFDGMSITAMPFIKYTF